MWILRRKRKLNIPGVTALVAATLLAATELYAGNHGEMQSLAAVAASCITPS